MSLVAGVRAVMNNHGPTILTVAGVTGVVGAGVMACRATIKASEIRIETVAAIEAVRESGYDDEKEYNKRLAYEYLIAARKFARCYGPAVILGTLSIASIIYGHNMLNKRNLALVGAYKALTMDYDAYRGRVAERLGEDIERSIKYNMQTITDKDAKGLDVTLDYVPEDMGVNPTSDRSVFFDESSIYWDEDPEKNKKFLIKLQEDAQKKLDRDGYLFLNWIYKRLDVQETYAGSVCGWVKGLGDGVVDFGIFDVYSAASRRFVNGFEPVILLNFNDDGYIIDKL